MPLKNPTRWVSEGCPLSTEWEVIERGFGGCARARGRIWRVSPGHVPPSKATLTESNRKIVTTLKIFLRCRCYPDWKILNNLCWLVQFYCSEDKFTNYAFKKFMYLFKHRNTHIYMRMKNIYIYIHVYKWICIHIIITHNEYNKFIYIAIYSVCVFRIFHLKWTFS